MGLQEAVKKASSIISLNLKDDTEPGAGAVEVVSPTSRQFALERLAEQFGVLAESADALGWVPEAVLVHALQKQMRAASIAHFERGELQLENVATLRRLISELVGRLALPQYTYFEAIAKSMERSTVKSRYENSTG